METVKILAIGDIHLKEKYLSISEKFISITLKQAEDIKPDFIVVLGDLLDTMNVARTQSHKMAVKFLKDLGLIAPVYFIIGNHDLVNHSQFLTDNHFFTPFHGVESLTGVTIIDKVTVWWVKGFMFVGCPYVPPGRFVEALNTLIDNDELWEISDCIFAHQEFKGAKMGAKISTEGDEWLENYPLVISGHIHDSQILAPNMYYTGSAIQHSFSEDPKKGVWSIILERGEDGQLINRYDILANGIRVKETLTLSVEEALTYIPTLDENKELRIKIVDEPSKIEMFEKTEENRKLKDMGIKLLPLATCKKNQNLLTSSNKKGSFWDNFYTIISSRKDVENTIKKYI